MAKKQYEFLFAVDRRRGIQAHIVDNVDEVIRVVYIDHYSLKPMDQCPGNLSEYLDHSIESLVVTGYEPINPS